MRMRRVILLFVACPSAPCYTTLCHKLYEFRQWSAQEFCSGGGGSTNSVEDRGQGSGGGSPLVRGSGGSCNLVQEI